MAEKKIADGTVRADDAEFESDTTGDVKMEGTRHIMQEQMQAAGDGVFEKRAKSTKERTVVPETGAAVPLDKSAVRKPAKRASKRK